MENGKIVYISAVFGHIKSDGHGYNNLDGQKIELSTSEQNISFSQRD